MNVGVAILTAGAGVAATFLFVDPGETVLLPPCPFRALTGWLCPGCGSARALHALVHGHWIAALTANPLAVAAVPLVVSDAALRARVHAGLLSSRTPATAIYAVLALVIAFGVVRNLV